MNQSILSLLHLSDPMLPIGGFSHSAGLETYVQHQVVNNVETAHSFVKEMLSKNLAYTDAAILSLAFDATAKKDIALLLSLDEECSAAKLPAEIRMASKKLGVRLLKIFETLTKNDFAQAYAGHLKNNLAEGNHCVVFGMFAQLLGINKQQALEGYFYNAAAGFVTNCVKLIPLGQQHGQEILFSLMPLIRELAQGAMNPNKDLIGFCCSGFDIRSMQHEHLYSRLYMS